jgi:hypothetical protein
VQQQVEHERTAVPLRLRHISGRPHEIREPGVGDGRRIDPERLDAHRTDRSFAVFRVALAEGVAHTELAARQRDGDGVRRGTGIETRRPRKGARARTRERYRFGELGR